MIKVSHFKQLKLDSQKDPQILFLYSLYDKAAGFFNAPVASALVPEQQVMEMRRAAMSGVYMYPNDLDLYLVGQFDTLSGRMIDSNSYLVGSLFIGDFARKDYKNDGSIPPQKAAS